MDQPTLSARDVAKILGPGWTHKKVLTYRERGLLPPAAMVLGQWLWTEHQIEVFQQKLVELEQLREEFGLKQLPWRMLKEVERI